MVTVQDVFTVLNNAAPVTRKMDFDNVGILVGDPNRQVTKLLTALDITDEVVNEAIELGAELIVSHHPLFFSLKAVRSDDLIGKTVLSLAENRIAAICMHTNLDISRGGVNDALSDCLGLRDIECLTVSGTEANGESYGLGRIGFTDEVSLEEYLPAVKEKLGANGLRYAVGSGKVHKVAVCGGSGGSELEAVRSAGCDTFITADVKYNCFLDAANMGINIIDAGHFPTEDVVVERLVNLMSAQFPELFIKKSERHGQIEKFFV